MQQSTDLTCSKTTWQGRQAYALENGLVRLVSLTGGGHIAEFKFIESSGKPSLNPLWTPRWKMIEPYRYNPKVHKAQYGPASEGRLLSGIAGHNVCLDYFGPPSDEEAAQGLPIHGEAGCAKWAVLDAHPTRREARLSLSVRLPIAGLRFIRDIRLLRGESVAYFLETVINETKKDQFFHWTQHVTLGPPFLNHAESRIAISATKGRTSAGVYGAQDLLKWSKDFRWPRAPGVSGTEVDLARAFTQPGTGFVATVLLDPRREIEFISALNLRHRLLIAYCFRRSDFPWVAIWEENKARKGAPWQGRSQARGLEFGSTPFPVGRREAFANGPLFGTPVFSVVPARARHTIRYVAFLAELPESFESVRDIQVAEKQIQVVGSGKRAVAFVPAAGHW